MRSLGWVLIGLVVLLQYPLWLGKGSWPRVWELEGRLEDQRSANAALAARNAQLAAEVNDLKTGYEALEARARFELGMIKSNELFYQVMEAPPAERGAEPHDGNRGAKP
jgi:cell division protein FtsB